MKIKNDSMTDYTATPEQWAVAELYGDPGRNPCPICEYACILELRARIEALEAVLPKPPSLAEEALEAMRSMQIEPCRINGITVNAELISKYALICRALERLQELEGGNG